MIIILIAAGMVPYTVFKTHLLLRRSQHSPVEHFVFHLYVTGHCALIFTTILIAIRILPETMEGKLMTLAVLTMLVYYIWAGTTFFNVSKIRTIFCITLALSMAAFSYAMSILLILVFYYQWAIT